MCMFCFVGMGMYDNNAVHHMRVGEQTYAAPIVCKEQK